MIFYGKMIALHRNGLLGIMPGSVTGICCFRRGDGCKSTFTSLWCSCLLLSVVVHSRSISPDLNLLHALAVVIGQFVSANGQYHPPVHCHGILHYYAARPGVRLTRCIRPSVCLSWAFVLHALEKERCGNSNL